MTNSRGLAIVRRARDVLGPRRVGPVARRIRADNLTYLTWSKLRSLERACDEARVLPGHVVECGVALGGSGILMSTLLPDRDFHGYDVFQTIPAPGDNDPPEAHERYAEIASGRSAGLNGEKYYGYIDGLYSRVIDSFARYGVPVGERVQLHRGLFDETLMPQWPVALAHIDCDWYDPVKLCLERLTPHLVSNALVVMDDYFDYGGCRRATDEHVASNPEFTVLRDAGHRVLRYAQAST
jgi:O-methyltransferase